MFIIYRQDAPNATPAPIHRTGTRHAAACYVGEHSTRAALLPDPRIVTDGRTGLDDYPVIYAVEDTTR